LFARWLSAPEGEPVEWYDELDASRLSIRCVRKLRDGSLLAHSYACPNWRDVMPEGAVPSVDKINLDPEFEAKEITASEFEKLWSRAVGTAGL
jgi:hypothetical protein